MNLKWLYKIQVINASPLLVLPSENGYILYHQPNHRSGTLGLIRSVTVCHIRSHYILHFEKKHMEPTNCYVLDEWNVRRIFEVDEWGCPTDGWTDDSILHHKKRVVTMTFHSWRMSWGRRPRRAENRISFHPLERKTEPSASLFRGERTPVFPWLNHLAIEAPLNLIVSESKPEAILNRWTSIRVQPG